MPSKDTDGKVVIEGTGPRQAPPKVPVSPKPPGAKPAEQAPVTPEVTSKADAPAESS